MSILNGPDGLDEGAWERAMSRPIATAPAKPTTVQLRELRKIAAGTCTLVATSRTARILARNGWATYGAAGRKLTLAGERLIGGAP